MCVIIFGSGKIKWLYKEFWSLLTDRASETYDMVQAASVEDSLSNLEGAEGFQNSKTKQTSTEDKKNEQADRNGSKTE